MVTATKTTKPVKSAILDDAPEETEAELTVKQIINEGIARVVAATGIDVQKNRYKAMRAISFQAFSNAISDGTFDDLVDTAIANVDELPSGWEIERVAAVEAPVKAKPVKTKPAATKVSAEDAVKPVRRRPAR